MSDRNRLTEATSPYLLQHAHQPVAWQPWDAAALAQARAEDKPILLSIGYAACHWCHVMAHESFDDAATAAVMNRLFVNIKVDREERPDLDQIYQTAHQLLSGRSGGWPLTVFLTPDGVPFYSGTYFPRTPRHGLPAFTDVCERIGELWRTRRAAILAQNRALLNALQAGQPPAPAVTLDAAPVRALRDQLLAAHDSRYGGFGGAPKFPHPTDLAFLLRRPHDAAAQTAALFSLRQMALGGLHDQLGGGFFRYSVDERWEIPHFEKMLYDNAQLLELYADAYAMTQDAYFADVARGIVDWLEREMRAATGAFYSSLDADAEGVEGGYYVWDRAEIMAALTPAESALAGRHWGLDAAPNFEETAWHLKVAAPLAPDEAAVLASARRKLLARRNQRTPPACDDKILTSWNALTIRALAHAGQRLARPDWIDAARQALASLRTHHWQDGRLFAVSRHGQAQLRAYLDDYAFLLAALLELWEIDRRNEDLDFACQLADALLAHFADSAHGGFFFTAHDHEALIQRPKSAHDNALPSGNGQAALALLRLGALSAEPRYTQAGLRTVQAFAGEIAARPLGCATLVSALEMALAVNPPVCDGVTCTRPASL